MRSIATLACFLLACSAVVSQSGGSDGGQPERQRDSQPGSESGDQGATAPDDADRRAALRAWLVRKLEESRGEQARLESMLQSLDAGQPLRDFRRDFHRDEDGDRDGGRGRRGGRFDDRRDGDHDEPSIDERIRLVTRFAREHFPEFAERLESEQQSDPAAARRIAARFWPRVAELRELEQTQPELFAVEIERLRSGEEIMSAVRRARRAQPLDEASRERIVEHLRTLSERHFELRLEAIRLRLESLRQSVRDTEQELEQRRAEREQSVEEQVQRLLRWIDRDDRDGDSGSDRRQHDAGESPAQRDGG